MLVSWLLPLYDWYSALSKMALGICTENGGGLAGGTGREDSVDWFCVSRISRDGETGSVSSSADESAGDAKLGVYGLSGAWACVENSVVPDGSGLYVRRSLSDAFCFWEGDEVALVLAEVSTCVCLYVWSLLLASFFRCQISMRSSATLLAGSYHAFSRDAGTWGSRKHTQVGR